MRGKIFVTVQGETHSLKAGCQLCQVDYLRVYRLMRKGESFEQALQWARRDTSRNARRPRKITLAGQTRLRKRWLARVGISATAWYRRKQRGWTEEQMLRPRLKPRVYAAFGRCQTLSAWCAEHEKTYKLVHARLKRGMPLELALTAAPGKYQRTPPNTDKESHAQQTNLRPE